MELPGLGSPVVSGRELLNLMNDLHILKEDRKSIQIEVKKACAPKCVCVCVCVRARASTLENEHDTQIWNAENALYSDMLGIRQTCQRFPVYPNVKMRSTVN